MIWCIQIHVFKIAISMLRPLRSCFILAFFLLATAPPAIAQKSMCPLPDDVLDWMRNLPISEVVQSWPRMLRKSDVWAAFVAVQEGRATATQFLIVQACLAEN